MIKAEYRVKCAKKKRTTVQVMFSQDMNRSSKAHGFHRRGMMREKDINGKYIGNAIGYCHCPRHEGALNHDLAYKHKCIAKKCKYLERYHEDAWRKKERYVR